MCRSRRVLLEVKPQTKLLNDLLVLTGPGLLEAPLSLTELAPPITVELIRRATDVKGLVLAPPSPLYEVNNIRMAIFVTTAPTPTTSNALTLLYVNWPLKSPYILAGIRDPHYYTTPTQSPAP